MTAGGEVMIDESTFALRATVDNLRRWLANRSSRYGSHARAKVGGSDGTQTRSNEFLELVMAHDFWSQVSVAHHLPILRVLSCVFGSFREHTAVMETFWRRRRAPFSSATRLAIRFACLSPCRPRPQLFRGTSREDDAAAVADQWRLALIQKGFIEVEP
jgi:hypothetical protein